MLVIAGKKAPIPSFSGFRENYFISLRNSGA
jgi:hypothetical protein